ncbi:MAG: hypothetical protein HZA94_02550 [Candidatus Vogelbacteria bacterium]|nr:hypothetical protein [Candidatus Vogelbacteria bacterium]
MRNTSLKPNIKYLKTRAGFVLLFALLISSILLATGLGISRIILREIFLASLGRESSVAFFAADTGAECALHWYQLGQFDLDTTMPAPSRTIYCNGQIIGDNVPGVLKINLIGYEPNVINGGTESTFSFLTNPQVVTPGVSVKPTPCALVKVRFAGTNPFLPSQLIVASRGYNNCNLTSPQTLERTLEYTLKID